MVYCGRPSASCVQCRIKKRKCDKVVPSCGHCCRTGQKCSGYNDATTLRVRDETKQVVNRAHTRKVRRMALASRAISPASSHSSPSHDSPSPVGTFVLTVSPDQAAGNLAQTEDKHEKHDNEGEEEISRDKGGKYGQDGIDEQEMELHKEDIIIGNVVDVDHSTALDLSIRDPGIALELDRTSPPPSSSSSAQSQALSRRDKNSYDISTTIASALPSPSLQELGMSYFLTNYVLQDSGPCPGVLHYSLDILADPSGDTELVQVAIRATGLAGLASTTGAYSIMCKARDSYTEAIKRVNAALQDSSMASNDSTIFAVLILGLFESITCSGNESLDAWKTHINGAANLLIHRGTDQFRTKQGLQIFSEAVSHVLMLCSRYNTPVPPRLRLLRVELERRFSRQTPVWALASAHIEMTDLYHRVDPDRDSPFLHDEWENLLSHAVELDRRIENLVAELPAHWRYKTVHDPGADPRIVYENAYHIYYNMWVVKLWNGIRGCRILLNQTINCLLTREGLAWAPKELSPDGLYAALSQRVSDVTTEMRDGILASVPQTLGFVYHDTSTGVSYLNCSSAGMPNFVPASGPYFLLWFLFLAGSLPCTTPETRAWVVDRFSVIRSATGIQQAGYLAELMKAKPSQQVWLFGS